jgi:hypothetical protein
VEQASTAQTCAESVVHGHSVIVIDDLATASEVEQLQKEAVSKDEHIKHAERSSSVPAEEPRFKTGTGTPSTAIAAAVADVAAAAASAVGRTRLPIADMLGASGVAACDAILLRALSMLDVITPLLTPALFPHDASRSPCLSPTSCVHNPRLVFSTSEPAINVYTQGGGFRAHQDKQSLTVLVSLSSRGAEFQGGGTAFWSLQAASDPVTGRGAFVSECTMALCPPAGSALVFGGTVTHAGQPVLDGKRCVFVASFSPASDEADAAVAATAIATTARHTPTATATGEALSRGAASDYGHHQAKQQRLRDQRNAYEARVAAERARQQALQARFEVLSTGPKGVLYGEDGKAHE